CDHLSVSRSPTDRRSEGSERMPFWRRCPAVAPVRVRSNC
ncbi:MAG: hypothetical protein AVDCRST_MAG70-445, partial [uncultured Thermomicrobiales bacterium]